jgi:2-phospho-L-lactate guanylyltransferase
MRTLAVLPVKRFALAKTRLRERLAPAQLQRLAEAMVADVLDSLVATAAIDDVVVVTNEPTVAALASERGARVLADSTESGQSAAAAVGIRHALTHHYGRVLLVPGDCPALDAEALGTLLVRGATPPAVTIVADRHGSGTNALLLTPPDAIEPAFGPDSFGRHRERASTANAAWHVEPLPGLLLDIDTAEDLDALRAALAGRTTRTSAVLAEL